MGQLIVKFYRSLLQVIPEGLAIINLDKKLLYANPTLKKIFQVNKKEDILNALMNLGKSDEQEGKEKIFKSPKLLEQKTINKRKKMQTLIPHLDKHFFQAQNEIRQTSQSKQIEILKNSTSRQQQTQSTFAIFERDIICEDSQKNQCFANQGDVKQPTGQQNIKVSMYNNENDNSDKDQQQIQEKAQENFSIEEDKEQCEINQEFQSKSQNQKNRLSYQKSRKSIKNLTSIPKFNLQDTHFDAIGSKDIQKQQFKDIVNQNNNSDTESEESEILSIEDLGIDIDEDEHIHKLQLQFIQDSLKQVNYNQNIMSDSNLIKYNQSKVFDQINSDLGLKQPNNNFSSQKSQNINNLNDTQNFNIQIAETQKNGQQNQFDDTYKSNNNQSNMHESCNKEMVTLNSPKQEYSFYDSMLQNSKFRSGKPFLNNKTKENKYNNLQNSKKLKQYNPDQHEQDDNFNIQKKEKSILRVFKNGDSNKDIYLQQTNVDQITDDLFKRYLQKQNPNINYSDKNKNIQVNNKKSTSFLQKFNFKSMRDDIKNLVSQNRNKFNRVNSFISHLKKINQSNEDSYIQENNFITKLCIKKKNKEFILQFILIDLDIDKQKSNPLILILVQDAWKELYQKKVDDLQKNKMKIFGSLSHELRTPLNCSISMLEVLKDQLSQQNPQYINEYINPALFSNKLLLNQINDILDFVQMDSGKFKYSFFDFNIENLLKDCTKLVSLQAQMKNLELYTIYDPNVPEIICSDPNRIRQIILNFLSNSLKFTQSGYIEIGIKLVDVGIYNIYVRDTGIGITESNLENLFDFCGKINYNKKDEVLNNQGCGLGLTISNSIAKDLIDRNQYEGGIKVESKYGEGSTFSILIQDRREVLAIKKQSKYFKMSSYNKNIEQLIQITSKQYDDKSLNSDKDNIKNNISDVQKNRSLSNQFGQSSLAYNFNGINQNDFHFENFKKQQSNFNYFTQNKPSIDNHLSKIDSATIIEEEEESKKIKFQPQIKINHSPWLKQDSNHIQARLFQQNSFQQKQDNNKNNQNSLKENSQFSKQSQFFSLLQIDDIEKVQSENSYIQNQKQLVSQSMTHICNKQTQNTSRKKSFYNQNTQNSNQKSQNNKINIIDLEQKSQLEQEGFTSYIIQNNKKTENSASLTYVQNPLSPFEKQRQTLFSRTNKQLSSTSIMQQPLDNFQQDEKKLNQSINMHPEVQSGGTIVQQIVNINQQTLCTCPQIIIVDDNQFNLYALSKIIKQFKFQCLTISNSLETMHKIKQMFSQKCCLMPKIIFMDIDMPIKDGYQVASEINQFYKDAGITNLPTIIACTSYVGQEDKDMAFQSGMNDFINKPILKNAFVQLLINWQHLFI
ncbi:ATPase, histidine kinase-, DNA gyrase B, putative (macronuclear) [Tetrahymena thermophila SB210]|uniref:histidine kinase n=1 Tax=Tetrahymena thermophila (strain SB210) TaxID=312017 RepID=I7LWI5_TETTS|nr:ATPase, histidine kinase-, DNA gyrase B, putative [Tetrahymena thermophila SB210]EAS01952.2 ATPase, histidine kinase-, DNA gyrase B, putative [Tetrahymena thermophila SB210]|eukprot:XP_001022197.2 ATPase, histidine kinase-, DNA gyrase B, putative [Tetrahymena thermophila SB210]